eukprot:GHVS01006075.1.p1 GENE.GHVS01006075.1~~GHVS01006075.1.p1  ORF type:complete len:113 (+),score=19.87 GHVS01006075.1:37-339(+)
MPHFFSLWRKYMGEPVTDPSQDLQGFLDQLGASGDDTDEAAEEGACRRNGREEGRLLRFVGGCVAFRAARGCCLLLSLGFTRWLLSGGGKGKERKETAAM